MSEEQRSAKEPGQASTQVGVDLPPIEALMRLSANADGLADLIEVLSSQEILGLLRQLQGAAPSLTKTLVRLEQLSTSGALDSLLELAEIVQAARVSMSDTMIAHLADSGRVAMELMDVLMVSGLPDRGPALLQAVQEARDAAVADTSTVRLWDLLMAPKEPELQFVLKFLLALARRLPKAMQA